MSTMPSTNDDSAKSGRVLHGRRGERQMLGRQAQLSLSLAALCVGPSVTQSARLGHHRTGRSLLWTTKKFSPPGGPGKPAMWPDRGLSPGIG
jgi:hypothetical protein